MYYGGSIRVDFRSFEDKTKRRAPQPPPDTRLVFTLAPQGKLADGREGQPLTYERKYDALFVGLDNDLLVDVPLAMYRMSGEELFPDGTRQPLQILDVGGKWEDHTIGTFQPDLPNNRILPVSVRFRRAGVGD